MAQNQLFKKRTAVELKESYGGFEVCNPEHIDFQDVTPKLVRSGSEIIKQFPSYEEAKKHFEEEVKKIYQAEVIWLDTKFKDSDGSFVLNGVKVNWKLKTSDITKYITKYHLEFNSGKTPNLITETGYRSDFLFDEIDEEFETFDEVLIHEIERLINYDDTGKKKKKSISYILEGIKKAAEKQVLTEIPKSVNTEKDTLQEQTISRSRACSDKNEEYCHLSVTLTGTGTLEEPKLSLGSTHQKPKGQSGSSWGGSYDISNNNEELMAKFLEFFKANAEKPWHSEIDGLFTTTLKIENCWVEFSKEAKEFMIKNGFDFVKYEEEVKKITQKIATQEDISKGKTFELMEKTMSKLRDECYAIRSYFENFLNKRKQREKNPYHFEQMKKYNIDFSDLNKLKELYESKEKTYHIYYCKTYEQRWGKPCDEEYSYV